MAWIAGVVAAAAGVYSAYSSAEAQNDARRAGMTRQKTTLTKALRALSPAAIAKVQAQLIPMFRAQIASTGAGNMGEEVRSRLAAMGLSNTPLGIAISDAAKQAPELTAFSRSLDAAMSIQQQKTQLLGQSFPYQGAVAKINPLAEGIQGGARGYASYAALQPQRPQQPQQPQTNQVDTFSNWINSGAAGTHTGNNQWSM